MKCNTFTMKYDKNQIVLSQDAIDEMNKYIHIKIWHPSSVSGKEVYDEILDNDYLRALMYSNRLYIITDFPTSGKMSDNIKIPLIQVDRCALRISEIKMINDDVFAKIECIDSNLRQSWFQVLKSEDLGIVPIRIGGVIKGFTI